MAGYSYQLICDNVPNAVVLTDFGPRVIEVVKVLRRRAGLSLWQGRSLLDRLPATVLEDVSQEMAEAMVRALVEVGAKAEVRQLTQLLDTRGGTRGRRRSPRADPHHLDDSRVGACPSSPCGISTTSWPVTTT